MGAMICCFILAVLSILLIGMVGYLDTELKSEKELNSNLADICMRRSTQLEEATAELRKVSAKHERATAMITELKKINKSITKRANRLASLLPKECE